MLARGRPGSVGAYGAVSTLTSRDEMATTIWAGANGFGIITLCGTPFDVHSPSLAPLT